MSIKNVLNTKKGVDMKKEKSIYDEFDAELKLNDKLVAQEKKTRKKSEMTLDFVNFIKTNNCKIKGDKNGKK